MAKTIKNIPPSHQLTDEEIREQKRQQAMQFLAQRRESFAINILCNLVQGAVTNKDATNFLVKELVDLSVEMADKLMEKLYPVKEK